MAKKKQGLEKSGQRNASEPIRHVLWHKDTKVNRLPFEVASRRDSAVLVNRSILLYDKQAISVKLSESSW